MKIFNKELSVEIDTFGAEIKSIKKNNVEYLWQGDPKFWKRSSPVLFPFVGKLMDNEYFYRGKTYEMMQHGFARDKEFDLIEQEDNLAVFLLRENLDTLAIYPFKFDLFIEYELEDNQIIVRWEVVNTNQSDMYFQIGGHPAFNFKNGSFIDINAITNIYQLEDEPHITNVLKKQQVDTIEVDDTTFINDAVILDDIDKVILRDKTKQVQIDCKGFPWLGLWSPRINGKNAPFICLEPWHGITDFIAHDKNLMSKVGVNRLSAGETFYQIYTITLT